MKRRTSIAKAIMAALAVTMLASNAFAQTWDYVHASGLVLPGNGTDLSHTLTIKAPTLSGSSILTMPGSNASGILTNDGSGNLTWVALGLGNLTIGSANQFLVTNSLGLLIQWAGLNINTTDLTGDGIGTALDIKSTYPGGSSIATVGTITSGTWHGTAIGAQWGGTGLNTSATTVGATLYTSATGTWNTLPGNTTSGIQFLTQTGNGSISAAPVWHTLASGDIPTLNQNTTGTANIAGGTVGAIPYQSAANTTTVLAATATAKQLLMSGASAAPIWSTNTYPSTDTKGDLLYASAANTLGGLPIGTSAQFLSVSGGVPSWTDTLYRNAITTTYTNGLVLADTTHSLSGTAVEQSPSLALVSHAWSTTGPTAADSTRIFTETVVPISSANPIVSNLTWQAGSSSTDMLTQMQLSNAGALNVATGYQIGGAAPTGHYLRGNGTNYVDNTIQAGDLPTLNQNTTGSAGSVLFSGVGAATNANALLIGTGGSLGTSGSGTITATAVPASGISGTTLASNVVTSSLTSVSTLTGGGTGSGFTVALGSSTITGQLALANGGTNANLTASNGGIFYSTSSAGAILLGTSTAKQILMSGASTAPIWSTNTYPATDTKGDMLYASGTNAIAGLPIGTSAQFLSVSGGIPSWTDTLYNNAITTTYTNGLVLADTTHSLSGTAVEQSPSLALVSHGWSTTGPGADSTRIFTETVVPISSANPIIANLTWQAGSSSTDMVTQMQLSSAGGLTLPVNGIAATYTPGMMLNNTTASTGGVTVQQSPSLCFWGHGWSTTGTAHDSALYWRITDIPATAAIATSSLKFDAGNAAAGYSNEMSISNSGNLSLASGGSYQINGTSVLNASTLGSGVTASSLTSFGSSIVLGTPASGTLTNCTIPASALTGTTLASSVTASSLTSFGSSIVLGTPASGTLTNCTIPASALTGATLASSVTASSLTSFGSSIVLGTPASGTLTNCTIPASALTGTTLAGGVTASSLTSLSTLTALSMGGDISFTDGATRNIKFSGATAGTTGNTLAIASQQGAATSNGGQLTITGGAGGATSGNGGDVGITGGTPTSGAGGNITLSATAGVGAGSAAGTITETAGAGAAAVTTTAGVAGGNASIYAGVGGAASTQAAAGNGGTASLTGGGGGAAATGKAAGVGGSATDTGGVGGAGTGAIAGGVGGTATLVGGTGGVGGTGSSGAGGPIVITAGSAGAVGSGTAGGVGGAITVTAGTGVGTGGTGGALSLNGGNSPTSQTDRSAGGVTINAGNTTGAGTSAITFEVAPVAGTGTGTNTSVAAGWVEAGTILFNKATTATALNAGSPTTLTAAEMLSGICVGTCTTSASVTTPTGAHIIAGIPGAVAGMAFQFTIVNLGAAAKVYTLTAGDGNVTITGLATVVGATSGTFLVVIASGSTVKIYRM